MSQGTMVEAYWGLHFDFLSFEDTKKEKKVVEAMVKLWKGNLGKEDKNMYT